MVKTVKKLSKYEGKRERTFEVWKLSSRSNTRTHTDEERNQGDQTTRCFFEQSVNTNVQASIRQTMVVGTVKFTGMTADKTLEMIKKIESL